MNRPRPSRGRGPQAVLLLLRSGMLCGHGCPPAARAREGCLSATGCRWPAAGCYQNKMARCLPAAWVHCRPAAGCRRPAAGRCQNKIALPGRGLPAGFLLLRRGPGLLCVCGCRPAAGRWPAAGCRSAAGCRPASGCCYYKMALPGQDPQASLLVLRRGLLHPLLASVLDAQRVRPRRPAVGIADLRDNMTRKHLQLTTRGRSDHVNLRVTAEALCWNGSGQRQQILASSQQGRKISWLLPAATCNTIPEVRTAHKYGNLNSW